MIFFPFARGKLEHYLPGKWKNFSFFIRITPFLANSFHLFLVLGLGFGDAWAPRSRNLNASGVLEINGSWICVQTGIQTHATAVACPNQRKMKRVELTSKMIMSFVDLSENMGFRIGSDAIVQNKISNL